VTALAFPDTEDLQDLANWYAANLGQIQALGKELRLVERRLTEYVKDVGAVRTANGLLSIEPQGFDWDDEAVALAMPSLVVGETLVVEGKREDVEELLTTIVQMPSLTYSLSRAIDKVSAARVIRQGGTAAAALEACRSPRGKLGLRS
jgi:hypothetical protein